jgi:hypothetical protein
VVVSYQEPVKALIVLIPPHEFWKWKDMWTNSMRTVVFAAALRQFLLDRTLISLPETAQLLGGKRLTLAGIVVKSY